MTKRHASPTSSSVRTIAILMAVVSMLYVGREILVPLSFAVTLALTARALQRFCRRAPPGW